MSLPKEEEGVSKAWYTFFLFGYLNSLIRYYLHEMPDQLATLSHYSATFDQYSRNFPLNSQTTAHKFA
jgi:hypothetical protein